MTFSLTIIGPPAAGKSSLTKELRRRVPILTSFSVRSYFGRALREGSPVGLAAAPYMETNSWIPDDLVADAAEEAIDTHRIAVPMVFEGMPGNHEQARLLDALMQRRGLPLPVPIQLEVDLEVCLIRSRTRRVCLACDDGSWPADEAPGQPGVCAACGGLITPRPADQDPIFRRRLETYRAESPSLLSYYPNHRLLRLDAERSTDELADSVLRAVASPSRIAP